LNQREKLNRLLQMTTVAERILSDFDSLDAGEKLLVRAHVVAVTQAEPSQTDSGRTIARLRGSGKGEHLLEKLLKDRAEERARGWGIS
jgi:hypothetical protein